MSQLPNDAPCELIFQNYDVGFIDTTTGELYKTTKTKNLIYLPLSYQKKDGSFSYDIPLSKIIRLICCLDIRNELWRPKSK